MHVQPIVYVTDMARSIEWYTTLLGAGPTMTSDHWSTFTVDGATVALHHTDDVRPAGNVALSLVTAAPLEEAIAMISPGATITEQPFGRSFVAQDPDGARIQVNEHA